MQRIITLAALAALVLAPLATASAASTRPERLPIQSFTIDVNAVGYYVSTAGTPPPKSAGSPVVQREAGNALLLHWTQIGTYGGSPAGYLQFSNQNFLAANSACDGATIKSSSTSSGIVWAADTVSSSGSTYRFVNRACDQAAGGHNDQYLEADGVQNDQFKIGDNSGFDTVMFIHVPT